MKVTNCPNCGGPVRAESIGWKCMNCQGFIDMQGKFHEHVERPFMPPMTRADQIRSMGDQEMAFFFTDILSNHQKIMLQRLADMGIKISIIETPIVTAAQILQALKQPVEGEYHD